MFIKFSVSNFRSIYEEQELSMAAHKPGEDVDRVIQVDRNIGSLVRVAAIYGANASGKSNFLRALSFFQSAVRDSQRRWDPDDDIPIEQFALGDDQIVPTRMSLDFLINGVRHQYGFTLLDKEFLSEWLYVFPNNRKQIWFERTDKKTINFGLQLGGPGMGALNRTMESLVRPNSLLLSVAAQNNYEKLEPVYRYITRNWIGLVGSSRDLAFGTARHSVSNAELKAKISKLLLAADLGIIDYEIHEEDFDESTKLVIQAMFSAMPEKQRGSLNDVPMKTPHLQFAHATQSGKKIVLNSQEESSGTLAYFGLLGPVCAALEGGGFIFLDEIEISLHPHLVSVIINLFRSASTNPNNAQLLFTTHQSSLLDDSLLARDEIWFAEKNMDGKTSIFPLTDFHLKRYEKVEKGYTQGRFGGVPNLDREGINKIFRGLVHLESVK